MNDYIPGNQILRLMELNREPEYKFPKQQLTNPFIPMENSQRVNYLKPPETPLEAQERANKLYESERAGLKDTVLTAKEAALFGPASIAAPLAGLASGVGAALGAGDISAYEPAYFEGNQAVKDVVHNKLLGGETSRATELLGTTVMEPLQGAITNRYNNPDRAEKFMTHATDLLGIAGVGRHVKPRMPKGDSVFTPQGVEVHLGRPTDLANTSVKTATGALLADLLSEEAKLDKGTEDPLFPRLPKEFLVLGAKADRLKAEGPARQWIDAADAKKLPVEWNKYLKDPEGLQKLGTVVADINANLMTPKRYEVTTMEPYIERTLANEAANGMNANAAEAIQLARENPEAANEQLVTQINQQRTNSLNDWKNYLSNVNDIYKADPFFTNTVWEGITKDLRDGWGDVPPPLNSVALADVWESMQNTKKPVNFAKAYDKALQERVAQQTEGVDVDGEKRWIKIPQTAKNSPDFEKNVKMMQAVSHCNWCTSGAMAPVYLPEGDFWVLQNKGQAELAIRFENGEIAEMQSPRNDGVIDPKSIPDVEVLANSDIFGKGGNKNYLVRKVKENEVNFNLRNPDFEGVVDILPDMDIMLDFGEQVGSVALPKNIQISGSLDIHANDSDSFRLPDKLTFTGGKGQFSIMSAPMENFPEITGEPAQISLNWATATDNFENNKKLIMSSSDYKVMNSIAMKKAPQLPGLPTDKLVVGSLSISHAIQNGDIPIELPDIIDAISVEIISNLNENSYHLGSKVDSNSFITQGVVAITNPEKGKFSAKQLQLYSNAMNTLHNANITDLVKLGNKSFLQLHDSDVTGGIIIEGNSVGEFFDSKLNGDINSRRSSTKLDDSELNGSIYGDDAVAEIINSTVNGKVQLNSRSLIFADNAIIKGDVVAIGDARGIDLLGDTVIDGDLRLDNGYIERINITGAHIKGDIILKDTNITVEDLGSNFKADGAIISGADSGFTRGEMTQLLVQKEDFKKWYIKNRGPWKEVSGKDIYSDWEEFDLSIKRRQQPDGIDLNLP